MFPPSINQSTIFSFNSVVHHTNLQKNLFNGEIHFTDDLFDTCLRSPRFSISCMEYSPVLEFVSAEKDLGLYITDDLTWSKHVGEQYAKANKLLGLSGATLELSRAHSYGAPPTLH